MKNEHIFIIGIIIIIIYVTAMFIILEPVTNKLKRTCDKFGMTYVVFASKSIVTKLNARIVLLRKRLPANTEINS